MPDVLVKEALIRTAPVAKRNRFVLLSQHVRVGHFFETTTILSLCFPDSNGRSHQIHYLIPNKTKTASNVAQLLERSGGRHNMLCDSVSRR